MTTNVTKMKPLTNMQVGAIFGVAIIALGIGLFSIRSTPKPSKTCGNSTGPRKNHGFGDVTSAQDFDDYMAYCYEQGIY